MSGDVPADAADPDEGLVRRLRRGEHLALARAITEVENDTAQAASILAAIRPLTGKARIVGVTGPPGVGKSTLIDAIVGELRGRGRTVSVLAIDPSSPLSGGAILGDRIRMKRHDDDPGVFVRSVASRGQRGGLSHTAQRVLQVMDAAGPDFIIVETVGAGQSDVTIADVAHVKLVVSAPGLGDGVQAIKAGTLEIADVLVVNKCDQPQAETAAQHLHAMLQLRDPGLPPMTLVETIATSGRGIPSLVDAIEKCAGQPPGSGTTSARGSSPRLGLARRAADRVQDAIGSRRDPRIDAICERVARGELDPDAAAVELVGLVADLLRPLEPDA